MVAAMRSPSALETALRARDAGSVIHAPRAEAPGCDDGSEGQMRCTRCDRHATHVTRTGAPMCATHAPADAWEPPRDMLRRAVALRRAQQPARGVVSDALLDALGPWARPHPRHDAEWRARVRQLLAESPLRDVVSACLEARMAVAWRRDVT